MSTAKIGLDALLTPESSELLAGHGGGSGVAFAWEMQLLASAAGAKKQAASVAVA